MNLSNREGHMRSNLIRCFFATVIFASLAFSVSAQTVGVFQGIVTDKTTGQVIQGAVITIEGIDMRRKYEVKTDKKGRFVHAGIPLTGRYKLIVRKEGYQPDGEREAKPGFNMADESGIKNFALVPGQAGGKLDFEMTPEEKAKQEKERQEGQKKQADIAVLKQFFDQGVAAAQIGQYEQAIELFKQAAEKGPDQPAVWANLASAYSKLKQFDPAIEAYNKAIALKADEPSFYQNLGTIYSEKGDIPKSKELYEKAAALAVALDPKSAATQYYNIGVTYINSGSTAEAETALRKALEYDANHPEAHYQLALTLLGDTAKTPEAIDHLKKYIEVAPNGPNAEVAKELIKQLGGK